MEITKPPYFYEKRSHVKHLFKFNFNTTISFEIYQKLRRKWLGKKSKMVEKKPPSEHKYSVNFVTKIGPINQNPQKNQITFEFMSMDGADLSLC